jgi:hypothetical protein
MRRAGGIRSPCNHLSKADSLNPTCLAAPAAVRPFFTKRANSVTKAVIAGVQRGPLIFGLTPTPGPRLG